MNVYDVVSEEKTRTAIKNSILFFRSPAFFLFDYFRKSFFHIESQRKKIMETIDYVCFVLSSLVTLVKSSFISFELTEVE